MDIEKLIEQFKQFEFVAYNYNINGEVLGMDCTEFECIMADAATALSTLQAENEKLGSELEEVKRERDAAVECIETVYAKILIKCKTDAVRAIEKWKNKERSDNEV